MANDYYIDDSYLQQQDNQEHEYWLFEQDHLLELANIDLQIEGRENEKYISSVC